MTTPARTSRTRRTRSYWFHLVTWILILSVFGWFIDAVSAILLPFIVGMLMAYLFDPVADRMEARGMARSMAAAVITLGFFSLLVALVTWLGPLMYHQLADLLAKVPALLRDLEGVVRDQVSPVLRSLDRLTNGSEAVPSSTGEVIQRAVEMGGTVMLSVLASTGALLNVLSLLLITPIVSFYLLRDWDRMVEKFDNLLPRAHVKTIRALGREMNVALAGYLRGQTYVIMILAVYYVSSLSLLGVKYSLLLGFVAGVFVIVPYLGTWISTGLALMVAYGQFGLGPLFWAVAGVFAVGQILESQILTPKVIGDRVGVHPLWLLFGMLAGAVLFGVAGVLLAVPITAVLSVLVRFAVKLYLESSLYKDA